MRHLSTLAIAAFVCLTVSVTAQVGTASPSPTPAPVGGPTGGLFTVYDGKTLRKGEYTFTKSYPEASNETLASKLMGRDMPYRVVLPAGYHDQKNSSTRYPVIYLLHGLTGHFNNWTDKTKIADYSATINAIIVTPEGEDGWYTDGATKPNDKYESYIITELIPAVDTKFRTVNTRKYRAIAGLSMGGYGAIKFGLKYPEMFSLVGSFSGALGAAAFPTQGSMSRMSSLRDIFGPADSDTRKANDIFRIVNEITAERTKELPFIYLDCGTEDFLFQNNREFVELLIAKKVPHEFRQLPGGHTWPYWDQQVQEFLRIADRNFRK
jgi:putative tributyrin esterase